MLRQNVAKRRRLPALALALFTLVAALTGWHAQARRGSFPASRSSLGGSSLGGSSLAVAAVIASGATITAGTCGTPATAAIDPGETVTVSFGLQNTGTTNTTNLVATLQATGGVSVPSGPQTYGAVVAGGAAVSRPFSFTATVPCGGTLTATLQLQDGATNLGTVTFNFTVGTITVTTLFAENFDGVSAPALPAGWTTAQTGTSPPPLFATTATTPDTAPNAAFTNGVPTVATNSLISPVINVPVGGTKQLTFRQRLNFENTTARFDGAVLEVSTDGGTNFVDVTDGSIGGTFGTNGYTAAIRTDVGNPLAGRQSWGGVVTTYQTVTVNFPVTFSGANVKFRWRAGWDSSTANANPNWRIDTLSLSQTTTTCAACANCPTIPATLGGGGPICAGGMSSVTVSVSGGTPPYTVMLTNGGGSQTGAGPLFTFPVSPGSTTTYMVAPGSGDANLCPLIGGGSATVNVNLPPTTANAGPDQTVCGLTARLAGNAPTAGTGTWTQVSGPGAVTFNNPSGFDSFAFATVAGVYTLRWTISNAPCTASSDDVVLTYTDLPTATISGGDVTVCGGETVTLAAPATPGLTYLWQRSLTSTGTFTNLGTAQTQPVTVSGVYRLTVTNALGCTASANTFVHVADYVFNGNLAPGDAVQTGRLNRFGQVSTCATPKSCPGTFSGDSASRLYDSYSVTNPSNAPVCATVGLATGCSTNIFTAAYSGSYDPTNPCANYLGDPGSSFPTGGFYEVTIPANGTVVFVVHEVNAGAGCASYSLTVNVPREAAVITANPSANICAGASTTLTAPAANSYLWTPGGATTRSIMVNPAGTTNYSVALGYGNTGCNTTANLTVNVSQTAANAGPDQSVCGLSATLAGNAPGAGTGMWTQVSGPGTVAFGNAAAFNSSATASVGGLYTLRWTISGCATSMDDVVIAYTAAPTAANAGPDQTLCGLAATLAGNTPTVGTGAWTKISGPGTVTFGNANQPNSSATAALAGAYTLRWTIANGGCTSTDDVVVTYTAQPTAANAGPDQAVCGLTGTLAGNAPMVGTGAWTKISGPGTVTFSNANSQTSTATASVAGSYTLRWTVSNPPCPASSDDVVITYTAVPTTANAGPDQTVCGLAATLAGNSPAVGTGTWAQVSGPGTVTFGNATAFNSSATATVAGAYTLRWTISNAPCPASSDDVVITCTAAPTTANAGPDQPVCGLTATLAGNTPSVGAGTWTQVSGPGTVTFTSANSPTSTATAAVAGAYTLRWTISNAPCPASSDDVVVTYTAQPTAANAGPDQTLCGTTATLAGNTPSVGAGTWTQVSGPGTVAFTNANSPTTAAAATAGGAYTLRWTIANGGCTSADDVVVNFIVVTVNPATLGNGTAGTPYSATLTATPAGTYNFAVTSGALPGGFTLSPAGLLSGTPPAPGTFNFTVTATSTSAPFCSGNRAYALTIVCPAITLSPASLPGGQVGTAYSQTVTASPAGGNYSYAVTSGVLPTGLSLNTATGAITGTPSAANNYAFSITATGFSGCTGVQAYNLLITATCGTITVNPASLPGGTIGTPYNQTVTGSGGTGPYTFSVVSGALPTGLTLDANTGVISGTPTAGGSFTPTIRATGQGGCTGQRLYVISVACGTVTINPAALSAATAGVAYSQQLTANVAGTFSLQLGSLPPGFTLSSTGLLSGTTTQTGSYNLTVKLTAGTCSGTRAYTLVVNAAAMMTRTALAQTADYDGDGKGDLALWANGVWRIRNAAQPQGQAANWGAAGDVSLMGDYDGDGKTDLAVWRPADGTWLVKRSSNGSTLTRAWGGAGDVPAPGDYDGDGQTDLAVWRPSEGNWYVIRSSDQQYAVTAWGLGSAPYDDVPVAGDYDGDGKTDLAVFRRATGTWLVKRSSDGQFLVKAWGLGTDVPVAADYDGDGQTDIAVWRGSTWYIWQSATNRARVAEWGANYAPYFDQAAPGDYDGDGQADVAVWRVSEQTWYIRCSLDGSVMTQPQGQAGDAPVSARRQ